MMRRTLDAIQNRVQQAMLDCVNGIRRNDDALAHKVLSAKREINSQLNSVLAHQAERLAEQNPTRLRIFRYEMEWVEQLKRIYTLSKRIAKLQLRKRHLIVNDN
jgi:phosphate:Na+ symporter